MSHVYQIWMRCFFLLHLLCIRPIVGDLSDIIKTDDEPTVRDAVPPAEAFYFLSTGLAHIFWSQVMSEHFSSQTNVTVKCKEALSAVSSGLSRGDILPFHFVDASSKTPPGFIRASMSSFGDYDQCLSIHGDVQGVPMTGKYCAVDLFPVRAGLSSDRKYTDNMTTGRLTFDRIAVFKRIPFIFSLCLPDQCNEVDLRNILSTAVSSHGLKVTGDISCDTKETTSFTYKLRSLNIHQQVALVFIVTLIVFVLFCSIAHLYEILFSNPENGKKLAPSFACSLSIMGASENLFLSKKQTVTNYMFDILKSQTIFTGIIAHVGTCCDLPLAMLVIGPHDILGYFFSSIYGQPFLAEHGLTGVSALTGVATAIVAYPLIKQGKLNYLAVFVDRFIRFTPVMAVWTSLEFLWPLSGDGPLWTRVAVFGTNRCTNNWWRNMLFINNYFIDANDVCGGSSFFLSKDLQLVIVGLIVLHCFSKQSKLGYLACSIFFCISVICSAFNVMKYNVTPVLYQANPIPHEISDHFTYVHMATYSYIPGYLIGIIAGYLVVQNKWPGKSDIRGHLKIQTIALFICLSGQGILSVYKFTNLIPRRLNFLVSIVTRLSFAIPTAVTVISMPTTFIFLKKKFASAGGKKVTKEQNDPETVSFDLIKGISRLSLSMFMTNFLVIRFLFFSSRQPMPLDLISGVTRIISFVYLCVMFAFLVHIFLLSPLDYARKLVTGDAMKAKSKTN